MANLYERRQSIGLARLLAWIESHGVGTHVDWQGRIWIERLATWQDGSAADSWDMLPANTMLAARDMLGY